MFFKMYKCPVCDNSFNEVSDTIKHIKVRHMFISKFVCKQNQCNRVFCTLSSFKKHLRTKHICLETHPSKHQVSNLVCEHKNLEDKENYNCGKNIVDKENKENYNCGKNIAEKEMKENYNCCGKPILEKEINTPENFMLKLSSETELFISKLYSNYLLPRNVVQSIVTNMSELFREPLQIFQNRINSISHDNTRNELSTMLKAIDVNFKNYRSEHLRFKHFKDTDALTDPVSLVLGQTLCEKKINSKIVVETTNSTSQYIPITKTLKSFLELPSVFEAILSYMMSALKTSDSGIITNIVQGKLWQETMNRFNEKIVLPIFLYADDFEVGNPLGNHAGIHKICGTYFSLGCLPPEYTSHLENIFLLQLSYTSDIKQFGCEKVYNNIISDLIMLETKGLKIKYKSDFQTVYFSVALILGDNLGLHSLLGLTESFRANYYCRFCRCHKNEAALSILENKRLLRTPDNYETDLAENEHGIKEKCIWHVLPNFHLTKNLSCDIMHDMWEGVCRYDFGNMLYYFICTQKVFTLETLNNRLKFFNFNDKNKPPSISKSQILQKYIIMSASEMCSFAKNFSLLIGDLIPENDTVWELYLTLIQIIDIITCRVVHPGYVNLLSTLISEHHTLYIELFGELKPKHHFLTHYPGLLLNIGPLCNVSCMRFEARHRQFKATARSVASRKNILYTLALKNQLSVCYRTLAQNGFINDFQCGTEDLNFYGSLEFHTFLNYFNCSVSEEDYFATLSVQVNGFKYCHNLVLVIDAPHDLYPIFGIIRSIIVMEKINKVYFIVSKQNTIVFSEHYRAYEVKTTNERVCVAHDGLYNYAPTVIQTIQNRYLVVLP